MLKTPLLVTIRNKFETLDNIVKAFDILLISKSKLDNTFSINQFAIGYKVFRRDRNRFRGGLILYINENFPSFSINQFAIGYKVFRRDPNRFRGGLILYINENFPSKSLNIHPMFSDLELIAFKLCQSKRKWLFLGIYKPPSQNDIEFLRRISLILDYYLPTYENFVVIGDFN